MTKRYFLATVVGAAESIELTESEYDTLFQSVDRLMDCVDVEEKFDGVTSNYRELESFIYELALHSLFNRSVDDVASQAPRSATARKLSNFLSSVRLYLDSLARHTEAISGESASAQIEAARSEQFDTHLSYRIMEALRNYAQHRALPVHGYSIGSSWTADYEFCDFEFDPVVNVISLAEDPDFKKKTLAEIINGPEKIRLKPMVREYVQSLACVHERFRELVRDNIQKGANAIFDANQRLYSKVGLVIYSVGEDQRRTEEKNVLLSLQIYMSSLQSRNRHLANFAKRRIIY